MNYNKKIINNFFFTNLYFFLLNSIEINKKIQVNKNK